MPTSAWPSCPQCGSEAVQILHETNPDAQATHATLECEACEHVFKDVLETPRLVEVHAVVSEGAESRTTTVEVPEDHRLRTDDEMLGDGHRLLVTALELEDGRRVRSADPADLGTVWCKVFDTVTVAVSVNQGHRTWSDEVTVPPEEEFFVGDELTLQDTDVFIHSIKTETGVRYRGSAEAREVKRLYARAADEPRIGYDDIHAKRGGDG